MDAPRFPLAEAVPLASMAERRCKQLARALIEAGEFPGASELAKVRAELAATLISNAETRATFVHRSSMDDLLREVSDVNEEADRGAIDRDFGMEQLDSTELAMRERVAAIRARAWVHCLAELDSCFRDFGAAPVGDEFGTNAGK